MATLQDVMMEFATRRSMSPPAVDRKTGGYALAVDGQYVVHLAELGSAVAAWIWLADLPNEESKRDELVHQLLRAELALLGEDGVVLSLDEAGKYTQA